MTKQQAIINLFNQHRPESFKFEGCASGVNFNKQGGQYNVMIYDPATDNTSITSADTIDGIEFKIAEKPGLTKLYIEVVHKGKYGGVVTQADINKL